MNFIYSLQSEWMKRRRSAATWLTLAGGLFIPMIILVSRFIQHEQTVLANSSDGLWMMLFNKCWQYMSIFLLPMGITLAASLIAQIEYRNNAWKQVYTTPQSLSVIFWSKYAVVIIMLFLFFILFNIGVLLNGLLPAVFSKDVPFPTEAFPFKEYWTGNLKFFINCLPILAVQYMLSLHIRNFVIPIGAGFSLLIASLIAMGWKHGYVFPYTYCAMQYLKNDNQTDATVYIQNWAIGYFIFFTAINYLLFIYQNKGVSLKGMAVTGSFVGLVFMSFVGFKVFNSETTLDTTPLAISKRMKAVEDNIGFVKYKIKGGQETTIEQRMLNYGIKGLSIAVIHNYKIEWAKAYGLADAEEKRMLTTETLFEPGSISKAVNALALMKLVEEKKLNLFTDVNEYLQSWKFSYDEKANGKKITLAQLLSHSAGLNIHGFGFEAYKPGDSLPTLIQILNGEKPSITPAVRSLFEPGLKFQYSGGGTMISQLILMDYTKQPYDNYMYNNVLKPLGMNNSFFSQPAPSEKYPLLATGYTQMNGGNALQGKYPVLPQQAAAGLWTNPTELAKMVIAVQDALRGKESFLKKSTVQLMLTPYNDESASLGFFIVKKSGISYFMHEAGNPGFSGKLFASMEDGNGVVICMNSDSGFGIAEEIVTAVASAYNWKGFTKPEGKEEKSTVTISPALHKKYCGAFRISNTVITVTERNNALYYKAGADYWKMYFTDSASFFNLESKSFKQFYFDASGNVTGIHLRGGGAADRKADKIISLPPSTEQMKQYAGLFTEPGGETAEIKWNNNQLFVHSENAIAPLQIHFISATEFFIDDNEGIFVFVPDNKTKKFNVAAKKNGEQKTILKSKE